MPDIRKPRRVGESLAYLAPDGYADQTHGVVWINPGADAAASDEPGAWLADRLVRTRGSTPVSAVVPVGYEAYARILHPARDETRRTPVRWSDVAAWSRRVVHPEVQWEAVIKPAAPVQGSPPWFYDPDVGHCPQDVRSILVEHLSGCVDASRCWAAVWKGWGNLADYPEIPELRLPGREYLLLSCNWEVLGGSIFGGEAEDIAPSLWWPPDRSWCVATEVDFRWTYVGGSGACVTRLLSDNRLESLATDVSARADYRSDTINGPVAPH